MTDRGLIEPAQSCRRAIRSGQSSGSHKPAAATHTKKWSMPGTPSREKGRPHNAGTDPPPLTKAGEVLAEIMSEAKRPELFRALPDRKRERTTMDHHGQCLALSTRHQKRRGLGEMPIPSLAAKAATTRSNRSATSTREDGFGPDKTIKESSAYPNIRHH